MKSYRHHLSLFILILCNESVSGQAIQKKFEGWWADTQWEFQFNADGTYSRISSGHYGSTHVQGTYRMKKDTILLISGYDNTHDTVNQKYLLDKDSMLIDLSLRYDYKPAGPQRIYSYVSKIREVKYPQIPTTDSYIKKELAAVLHRVFRSDTLRNHFSVDTYPGRKWYLQQYKYLDVNFYIPGEVCVYVPADQIKVMYYIEIEDINYNENSIEVELNLHGQKLGARFFYYKRDGKWSEGRHYVFKNEY